MSATIFAPATNQKLNEGSTTAKHALNQQLVDNAGQIYAYLKANEALEQGEAVMPVLPSDIFTPEVLPGATAINTKILTLTTAPTNVTALMICSISDGTGEGQWGIVEVVDVTNKKVTVNWVTSTDGTLALALDTTSEVTFSASWLVKRAVATTTKIPMARGFVMADVASASFFPALVNGIGHGRIDTAVRDTPTPGANQRLIITSDTGLPGHLTAANDLYTVNEGGADAAVDSNTGPTVAYAIHDNNADSKLITIYACCPLILGVPARMNYRWNYQPALT